MGAHQIDDADRPGLMFAPGARDPGTVLTVAYLSGLRYITVQFNSPFLRAQINCCWGSTIISIRVAIQTSVHSLFLFGHQHHNIFIPEPGSHRPQRIGIFNPAAPKHSMKRDLQLYRQCGFQIAGEGHSDNRTPAAVWLSPADTPSKLIARNHS